MKFDRYLKEFDKVYKNNVLSKLNIFSSLTSVNSNKVIIEELPIKKSMFYFSKDVIKDIDKNENIGWRIQKNNIKMLYLSYKTLNNKFEVSPADSFFKIKRNEQYYINISLIKDSTIDVTPIIIHYSEGRKSKLSKVIENNQFISFDPAEDKCRLTFKLIGHGEFFIKNIQVLKLQQGDE